MPSGRPGDPRPRDIRRHLAGFIGTAAGLGLLLSVVIAMQGIYAGMVDDATILTRAMRADLGSCSGTRVVQALKLCSSCSRVSVDHSIHRLVHLGSAAGMGRARRKPWGPLTTT